MRRGPAPTPSALRDPMRRPANEPQPAPVVPDRPAHLHGEAVAEWERIVPELAKLGLLTRIDRTALAAYCVAYGRWTEAEAIIARDGFTVHSPNGYPQKHPALAAADKAMDQLLRYIQEFGLSPASRTRVAATPPPKSEDAKFFGV